MAIYHCSIKIVSRGKGKSAVAAAAYRAGEKLTNEWDGLTHDYTRKGGVIHSEIMLPTHAPPSFSDRSTLWNSVEEAEKSNNAQLAREVEIALPVELSREEQTRLVREYCSSQFVSKGMCADFNIHDTGGGNPHAHILLTMRPMDERGKWLPKSKKEYVLDENGERVKLPSGRYKTRKVDLVDWNSQENAELWRKAWADLANEFLERNNSPERIDHRSFERQGIDQIPTVHVGVSATQMEKKGIPTERGELNRNIKAANRIMREIRQHIASLKDWLVELFNAKKQLQAEPQQPKSPDLATLLFKYMDIQKERDRKYSQSWQRQHTADELKAIAKAVNLLSAKGISDLDGLDAALSSVSKSADTIRAGMVQKEKRIKQLEKLIEYAQSYQRHKPIHDEFKQIRWKGKQEKYGEEHRAELALWEAANRYLRANLPDMKLTVKAWQTELAKLTAEDKGEYAKLKERRAEVAELQKIRRYVDVALKADAPEQTRTKKHEQER
ncbi:MAG: MobA/MobL family protein [Oscillospiraceae bacterium]|nr:MobA/MobL family protein [Oscillospiraceae bacterium]